MADDDDRTDVHQADLIYDDGVKQLAGDLSCSSITGSIYMKRYIGSIPLHWLVKNDPS